MSKYNDIDMSKWRDYTNITTDSLWLINSRDNSGAHSGSYHGNFVPQIPRQLFSRYTQKGDWILDPFMGSGTALIEAQRMSRSSLGIDLQAAVVQEAQNRLATEHNPACVTHTVTGDSRFINMANILTSLQIKRLQFVIMHPPYWDIIKFSDNPGDLSNAPSLDAFLTNLAAVIDNTTQFLEKNRYCALVIGDKYANSQVVPLGFYCMNLFLDKARTSNFLLKAILVKNFGETRGKANKQGIWRYRALASDFYIFKHEYIFVFKKLK